MKNKISTTWCLFKVNYVLKCSGDYDSVKLSLWPLWVVLLLVEAVVPKPPFTDSQRGSQVPPLWATVIHTNRRRNEIELQLKYWQKNKTQTLSTQMAAKLHQLPYETCRRRRRLWGPLKWPPHISNFENQWFKKTSNCNLYGCHWQVQLLNTSHVISLSMLVQISRLAHTLSPRAYQF